MFSTDWFIYSFIYRFIHPLTNIYFTFYKLDFFEGGGTRHIINCTPVNKRDSLKKLSDHSLYDMKNKNEDKTNSNALN